MCRERRRNVEKEVLDVIRDVTRKGSCSNKAGNLGESRMVGEMD